MSTAEKLTLDQLDVFLPFEILGTGSAQGSVVTTLEEVVGRLLNEGVTPEAANIKRFENGVGRSDLPRVGNGETAESLQYQAVEKALKSSGVDTSLIGAVVVGTSTPERWVPDPSKAIHARFGLPEACQTYTLANACQGGMDAMMDAAYKIGKPGIEYALAVGVDVLSPYLRADDADTQAIFSDMASAVLLGPSKDNSTGLILDYTATDSSSRDALTLGPGLDNPMEMDGTVVGISISNLAVKAVYGAITRGNHELIRLNKDKNDGLVTADLTQLTAIASHQPSSKTLARIVRKVKRAGIDVDPGIFKDFFEETGNASAAVTLRVLDMVLNEPTVQEGAYLGMLSAAVGSSSRFSIIKKKNLK